MLYKLLCLLLLACIIGCTSQSNNDDSIFPTPPVPEPTPIRQPVPVPQPVVHEEAQEERSLRFPMLSLATW